MSAWASGTLNLSFLNLSFLLAPAKAQLNRGIRKGLYMHRAYLKHRLGRYMTHI